MYQIYTMQWPLHCYPVVVLELSSAKAKISGLETTVETLERGKGAQEQGID